MIRGPRKGDGRELHTGRTSASTSPFSYANKSTASLQLLKADFYAFALLLRGDALRDASLSISRLLEPVKPGPSTQSQGNDAKQTDKDSQSGSGKGAKPTLRRSFTRSRARASGANVSRHSFLGWFRAQRQLRRTASGYNHLFAEFENYVIKLFSIHPTLGSTDRGLFLEDDGSMIESCLNYVRCYESSVHLLSQKLHHYFYLSAFLLIVLLRNLRRFLHHYKSNSTFFDFLLIAAEGICLCQNHLFKSFTRDRRVSRSGALSGSSGRRPKQATDGPDEHEAAPRDTFHDRLRSLNLKCAGFKEEIYALCRAESKQDAGADKEPPCCADDETTCSGDESVLDSPGFASFYENINPMMTAREERFESTLDYDKFELFQLPNLNVLLDCKIYRWTCELCELAHLYARLGRGPALLENRFTKLALDAENSVLPRLCRVPLANLSALRLLRPVKTATFPTPKKRVVASRVAGEAEKARRVASPKAPSPRPVSGRGPRDAPRPSPRPAGRAQGLRPLTHSHIPPLQSARKKYERWNDEEVSLFLKAVNAHGDGRWRFIEKTYFLGKKNDRQLKDKWANLLKFGRVRRVDSVENNGRVRTKWVLLR